jgi:hypothetical protein
MPHWATSRQTRILLAVPSGVAGATLVVAAFKVDSLNWMVDGPGWIITRFLSVDIHEGEGALGFFLAILLGWLCWSLAVWFLLFGVRRLVRRG